MRSALLCCALAIFSMHSVFAFTDWKDIGMGCAVTVQVTCHPTQADVIYYVADAGHVFRSTDRGKTYQRISQRVALAVQPHRQFRAGEHCVAVDRRKEHGNVVYYSPGCEWGGLWKSEKLGDPTSWKKVGPDHMGQCVVGVNYLGHVLVFNIEKKIFLSRDMGKTWETVARAFPFQNDPRNWNSPCNYKFDLAISKMNHLWGTDRTKGGGAHYSTDNGKTWTNVLKGKWIMDLDCSPTNPDLIMALDQNGEIYRSGDGGKTFKMTGKVRSKYWRTRNWPSHETGIAINGQKQVIAIGRWEMGISKDEGKTWTVRKESEIPYRWKKKHHETDDYINNYKSPKRTEMNLKCCDLSASPVDPNLWAFGCGQIVKKSIDAGHSWRSEAEGLHGLWTYGMPCVDIDDPNVLHVPSVDCGHGMTTDLGKTWKYIPGQPWSCEGIAQDPNNPDIFYRANGYGKISFFKSTNRGKSFKKTFSAKVGPGTYGGRMYVDPSDSNIVWFTMRGSRGVWRSEDAGMTYRMIYAMPGIHHSMITRSGNLYFHVWNGKGLYRYTKKDDKWENIAEGIDIDGFDVHPEDENIIYINSGGFPFVGKAEGKPAIPRGSLCKTTNGASSKPKWDIIGNYGGINIYIDPYRPQYMLMMTGRKNVGMMYSSDSGKNWKSIHNNHATSFIWGFVAGGPKAKGRVYTFDSVACYIDDLYNPKYTGPEYNVLLAAEPGKE